MISIIIPVYNVEQYLPSCLDSVLKQDYHDWECILVDDGSRDQSPQICDDYQMRDARFHVIHQQNLGVSAARNAGLTFASGEFISFVDSDDWLDPAYLSSLLCGMSDSCDLAVGGIYYGDERHAVESDCQIYMNDCASFLEHEKRFIFNGVHRKLYRKSLIDEHALLYDINYDYGEDLMFVYSYLRHCRAVMVVAGAHYHYTTENEVALTKRIRKNQFDIDYLQWQMKRDFFAELFMLNEAVERHLAHLLWGLTIDGVMAARYHQNEKKIYLQKVLAIKEVALLTQYKDEIVASSWIKMGILKRLWWLFYMKVR